MQRAVDELITLTLMKKVVVVCRSWNRETRGGTVWLTNSKRQRKSAPQLRKWANQDSPGATKRADSRLLSSRDSKTRVPGRLWKKKYSKVEWSCRVSQRRNLSCSSRRRTTSTRSTTSSWTIIGTKSGSSWSSWEKSQWHGRIEAISRFNIRYNFGEKIGRRSRYYPWTRWQDTGIAEWNQLCEWFERFSRCWISKQWTIPRYQSTSVVFFPPHPDPGGMLSRSIGMPSRKDGPPSIWITHGISGNVFANPTASSSAPYPQESNPWISNVSERTSPYVMSESQTPVQGQRCQSGPSARNSVIPSEEGFSKNYGAGQQRLQIADLHFDKFSTSATFACWMIRFKTEVCTCSQFLTEAMQWIKEVELVDSVDDLKSSCSVRGFQMPNFEVLDAKIASALNRIIHNTQFKRKVSLEEQKAQKEDRFFRGRQIAYLIYEYFLVTGANDSVENYADLFTIVLRNDDIQEFDAKWDGIAWSMTKIPSDDILEGVCKLVIRESEKLKTVVELYKMEIHQKKLRPDYHRLTTMVKRSIEQDIRNKNFGARSGNFEKNAVVKNQGTKQRARRTLGDCWQWKANGQCSKGDSCSFRHDINKRGKSTQPNPSPSSFMRQNERNASRTRSPRGRSPSGRMSRWPCKDHFKRTCTNSFCE